MCFVHVNNGKCVHTRSSLHRVPPSFPILSLSASANLRENHKLPQIADGAVGITVGYGAVLNVVARGGRVDVGGPCGCQAACHDDSCHSAPLPDGIKEGVRMIQCLDEEDEHERYSYRQASGSAMIWIGTSGWIYPHWVGRFYPSDLPLRDHLAYYAKYFPTVEINRSFYRLPSYDQFHAWGEQIQSFPGFRFSVKASQYITHMKKLQNVEEGISRLYTGAIGLGQHLGPFLYQLPPHWHANLQRLEQFIFKLPHNYQAAFEFRDPTWFQPENLQALCRILDEAGCVLVIGVGGSCPTPPGLPAVGPFRYVRFHHGAHGIGLSDEELESWVKQLSVDAAEGRQAYVYFNNDPEGYAILNAQQLQKLLGKLAVLPG